MARHPKRPRDMMELAKMVGDIATGEQPDDQRSIDRRATKRGVARAESLSPKKRSKIARKAARARWKKEG